MPLRALRLATLVLAALALTMTSAHVLELPQKMTYDPALYAAVNGSLYRWFAVVGGAYEIASILLAFALAYAVRDRPRTFAWTFAGALLLLSGFVAWAVLVEPVNRAAEATAPRALPSLWGLLRPRWEYGHAIGFVLELLGLVALVASVVRETSAAPAVVHAKASRAIAAPRDRLFDAYANHASWDRLFPLTIRGTRLVDSNGDMRTIAVDHRTEGTVTNVMRLAPPDEIRLTEWKRRFDARFVNRFDPIPGGTRVTVIADVTLKGALALLAPIAAPFVRSRIERFVLEPLARATEPHPPRRGLPHGETERLVS